MTKGPRKRKTVTAIVNRVETLSPSLLGDIRSLIEITRSRVATTINSELVLLYWQIGTRIRQDILQNQRAEYGEQIVHALSGKLTTEYGKGFTKTNLFNMIRFAEVYPDAQIVHAVRGQSVHRDTPRQNESC